MPIMHTKVWRFLSSVKLVVWLLAVIAAFSVIGTIIPQNEEPAFYIAKYGYSGYTALKASGLTDIYLSWYFMAFLILLFMNQAACLLKRSFPHGRTLGSFMSHLSVLVILSGALIGMLYGQKGFLVVNKKEKADSFMSQRDKEIKLGFSVRLDDFIYTENIDPKETLSVYYTGEQFPEASGISPEARELIAQFPIEIGREQELSNTGYKLRILRYVPDFTMDIATKKITTRSAMPNNPAIEAELKDREGKLETFWAFARYPDMHKKARGGLRFVYNWAPRRPKDFISKVTVVRDGVEIINKDIRVNAPLRFGGYTFFQSSYDAEGLNWSGLKIAKDPGVPLIYSGFILLVTGLVMMLYCENGIRRFTS